MKYLVWCRRHNSLYGKPYALFWGYREAEGDYSSDVRVAHRFSEEDIKQFNDKDDIPIPIDFLGLSEDYTDEKLINNYVKMMVEKGSLMTFIK